MCSRCAARSAEVRAARCRFFPPLVIAADNPEPDPTLADAEKADAAATTVMGFAAATAALLAAVWGFGFGDRAFRCFFITSSSWKRRRKEGKNVRNENNILYYDCTVRKYCRITIILQLEE